MKYKKILLSIFLLLFFVARPGLVLNNTSDYYHLHTAILYPTLYFYPINTLPRNIFYDGNVFLINADNFVYASINKNVSIGTFIPPKLKTIPSGYSTHTVVVSEKIVDDLVGMIDAAKADGITLKVVSGYRSYSDQVTLFNSYVNTEINQKKISRSQAETEANTYSAKPGHSEHQLGTTVDILSSESNYTFGVNSSMKFVQWIQNNSSNFNFFVSYPEGNPEYKYEPWHLRWKGNL